MPTLFDVDTYICSRLPSHPGKVARHKLLYGVHRLAIYQNGTPMFDSFCAAFPLGPVFVELLNHPERKGDPDAIASADKQLIDTVLERLGALSGRALAARSHKSYYEWFVTREGMRDNQVFDQGQYREIPVSLIKMLPEIRNQGPRIGFMEIYGGAIR